MHSSRKISNSQTARLIEAVEELNGNFRKLHTRLLGDEAMQTKGLIHEVDLIRTSSADAFKKGAEIMAALEKRMQVAEQKQLEQEAINAANAPAIKKVEESWLLGRGVIWIVGALITGVPIFITVCIWALSMLKAYLLSGSP